jgi:DNA primase
MDRLKLVQLGIPNAVAILGWKASNQQIQRLQAQGIRHVISALDNDDCGRRGTEWLRKHFVVTRFRYLKGIKDPGDFTAETFSRMNGRTLHEYKQNDHAELKGN